MERTEEKLLLVDGHNLLFQMFYGMPARIVNREGRAIQGTLGFVGALLKILRRVQPSHMAVIFDGEHENRRKNLSEDYKANRPDYSQVPEEENPFSQLPDVYRALQYLGIPYWETQEYEADDEIAAYVYMYGTPSERCESEPHTHSQIGTGCVRQKNPVIGENCDLQENLITGRSSAMQENLITGRSSAMQENLIRGRSSAMQENLITGRSSAMQENLTADSNCVMAGNEMQIVISSFDSDFFQLIRPNVSVLRYRGEKTLLCDEAYIREKLGIAPSQYAEYKALTGDKADNIAGIRGVGPKTAADLMRRFGTLEELLAHQSKIQKPSIRKALAEAEEQLRRNYRLIRLDGGAPVLRPLAELVWQDSGLTTTEVLAGIGLK